MSGLVQFKYNANNFILQSVQYGSDQYYNPSSVINMASYDLFDSNNIKIGYIQFIDNGVLAAPYTQLYNETASFFIQGKGTIVYNTAFVSGDVNFSEPQVIPTVISASGEYYRKVDQIAIDTFENGDRNVWISFK